MFFRVFGPDDPSKAVVSLIGERLSYDDLDSLAAGGIWVPRVLEAGPGVLVDFPPNNLVGWSALCSERLKHGLEPFSGDCFRWLQVAVTRGAEQYPYFSLYPVSVPDVLDEKKTIRNKVTQSVIKPVLSGAKVAGLQLFLPEGVVSPVCSGRVKDELERQGVTGLEFSRIPLV